MPLTSLVFLLLFAAGLLLCVIRNPIYGLYTYIGVFYLDAPSRWWGYYLPDLRWSLLAGVVTLACTVIRYRGSERPSVFSHLPVKLFVAFVVILALQTPFALNPEEHRVALSLFPKYLIVIYLFYTLADSVERVRSVLFVHVLGCLYLGFLAYTSYSGGRLDGVGGPGIGDANNLSVQLATGAFAAAAIYLSAKGPLKWISAIALAFILNGIIMTGARGGFLALIAGGLVFFLFRAPGSLKVVMTYGTLGVIAFFALASDFFWERMQSIPLNLDEASQIEDGSVDSRLVLIQTQWQMFLDYPLGGGHRTTTALSYTYLDPIYHSAGGGRASHNTFMSALVDQGFIGFLIWVGILVALLTRFRRIRRQARAEDAKDVAWLNAALAAGVVVITVAGMFYPLLRLEAYTWLMSLTCTLTALTVERAPAEQPALAPTRAAS